MVFFSSDDIMSMFLIQIHAEIYPVKMRPGKACYTGPNRAIRLRTFANVREHKFVTARDVSSLAVSFCCWLFYYVTNILALVCSYRNYYFGVQQANIFDVPADY